MRSSSISSAANTHRALPSASRWTLTPRCGCSRKNGWKRRAKRSRRRRRPIRRGLSVRRCYSNACGYGSPPSLRAACHALPPGRLHVAIGLAAAPSRINGLGSGIGLKKEAEAFAAPGAAFRNVTIDRRPARHEAALGLVVQRRDELGAIVGLAAQRLVRDNDRGSRQCSRRDAIEHILRDGDAVERVLGVVPVVDRDRGPAQARVVARHRREHMPAERLVGIADRDRNLDGRIEYLAPVRPLLMSVAPHVKLLRRAADVDRDRLERELRLARRLGGVGLLGLGPFGGGLCGGGGGGLVPRLGPGGVELRPEVRGPGGGLLPEVLGPRLGLVRL